MRFAKVSFTVGLGLFGAAGIGLTGMWALVVSTVAMGLGALVAVVIMEDREYAGVEGLYPAASDSVVEPALVEPDDPALRHAA